MKKVTKAVIPAAGLGTRVLPATKAMPKGMLPIVDKPAIQYLVEEAVRSGITDILTKSMGSATAVNMVRATVAALKQLEEPEEIAARRGLALNEVAPDAMLRARAAGIAEAKKAREEAQAKAAAEQKDGE